MQFLRDRSGGVKAPKWTRLGAVALLVVAAALAVASGNVEAQQLPSADQLQQLQQQMQNKLGSGGGGTASDLQSQQVILEPNLPPNQYIPPSRLEQLLSSRAGVQLRQFGYDQLGVGRAVTLPQMGAIQDSYILGPGDEIVVSLRGQENAEYRAAVDRDGVVTLPRLKPIAAGGRTLGDFRRELIASIQRAYVATEGYVTIGRLRQISVIVSGELNSPGVRTLTGLSTAADAILVSGGIKKTGSLRSVYILRGEKRITVDLYGLLTGHGLGNRSALADGDRIVVPPLGPTVAVVGWVRRPGIYELPDRNRSISVRELLSLAGGLEVRGKYRFSVLSVTHDGRNQMSQLEGQAGTVGDSDVLFAQPAASETTSTATLSGGTALAGKYATTNTKLSQLLKSPGALGQDPYTLFGIISRRDPVTLLRTLVSFTPVAVLAGSEDLAIQSDDIVRVISTREARVLVSAVQQYRRQRNSTELAQRNPQAARVSDATNNTSGTTSGTAAALQSTSQYESGLNARQALSSADQFGSNDEALDAGQYSVQSQGAGPIGNQQGLGTGNINQSQWQNSEQNQQLNSQQYSSQTQQPMTSQYSNRYQQQGLQLSPSYQQYLQNSQQYPSTYQQYPPAYRQYPSAQNLEEPSGVPGQVPTNLEVHRIADLANQLRVDPLVLVSFLEDRSVNVDGAVQGPGLYFVGPDADLRAVLTAAGGTARWADRSAVEVISTFVDSNTGRAETKRRVLSLAADADAGYVVSPQDEVRINSVFTAVGQGSVTVQGQVRQVGTYQIVRGEHLSDVLMRAGGLTDSAYPYGTVFLRRSVAEREQDAFRREAQQIEDQLLMGMSRRDPNSKLAPDAFNALQGYVNQLRNQRGVGRVTVAADPALLAANPALDPLMEPGDVIYVPPRPYSVSVLGEVLQPGSVPFRKDFDPAEYIEMAGGYSQFADKSEAIIVLPNGSARRIENSWIHIDFGADDVPPGSTIYVARDVSGVDLHQIITDTTSIVSQLAVTAASLAVLSKQ